MAKDTKDNRERHGVGIEERKKRWLSEVGWAGKLNGVAWVRTLFTDGTKGGRRKESGRGSKSERFRSIK
jgi:hypothetical protein